MSGPGWQLLLLAGRRAALGAPRASVQLVPRLTEEEAGLLEALARESAPPSKRAVMYDEEQTAAVTLQCSLRQTNRRCPGSMLHAGGPPGDEEHGDRAGLGYDEGSGRPTGGWPS